MNTATPQMSDQVLAVVDNTTAMVWYVGRSKTLEAACEFVARQTGRANGASSKFLPTLALGENDDGYAIHDATGLPPPATEREERDIVKAAPLLRLFRLVA